MYLGIDIGGTKTLVATFTNHGDMSERIVFETPEAYPKFIRELAKIIANLTTNKFIACGLALPGKVDRIHGIGVAFGNLEWHNVPIQKDIKAIIQCPVVLENDANLAGLSEAILIKDAYSRVLYVTISTGIGTGIITNQHIDPDFQDAEGGHIILEHKGQRQRWERFASGSAIVRRFHKKASDIDDAKTWRIIGRDIAIGLTDLAAVVQPQVIIIGGSVGDHFGKYKKYLLDNMKQYDTPLTPMPKVIEAGRPKDAVAYGCYYLACDYAKSHTAA